MPGRPLLSRPRTASAAIPATTSSETALEAADTRRGTLYGAAAYLLWGVLPLYLVAVQPAGAVEILAHRVVWSVAVCLLALVALRRFAWLRALARRPRQVAVLGLAGVLVATNWTVYVIAVLTERVNEAALGYFLNPLVTVALGVLVLRERLRRLQWLAVAIGAGAAGYLTVVGGSLPWIPLTLAFSFGLYGLVKKRVGGHFSALQSFTVETLLLAPVAALVLVALAARGEQTFTGHGAGHALLLAGLGVVTALPLLLFAAAARRVPLVTVGLLQFLAPVLQLLCGVLVLGEVLPLSRWIGFGLVWGALALLTADLLMSGRRRRRAVSAVDPACP